MADGSKPVIGPMTSILTPVSNAFTRPADTDEYTADDLIANDVSAGSVVPLSWASRLGAGTIRRVKVSKGNPAVATPTIRLWLFSAAPVVAAGDNDAFASSLADVIDHVDVEVTSAGSDEATGWASCDIPYAADTVYALMQTRDVFAPASEEVFTVELTEYPG